MRTAQKGRKLNSLNDNIKCGNSLIDDIEVAGEKAFSWETEFPDVFFKGGFDVIIGNPPYVRVQHLKNEEVDYYFSKFNSPCGKLDISILFFELSVKLIKNSGLVSFISSSQWMQTDYGKNIRKIMSEGIIKSVVDFGSLPVFFDADTYPAIFQMSHKIQNDVIFKIIKDKKQLNYDSINAATPINISSTSLDSSPWKISEFDLVSSLDFRKKKYVRLNEIAPSFIGDLTGMDKAFIMIWDEALKLNLENDLLLPYAYRGEEVINYETTIPSSCVIYPYINNNGKSELLSEIALQTNYPNIYKYLSKFRPELEKRIDSRKLYATDSNWFRHLRAGNFHYVLPKKIIIKGVETKLKAGLLEEHSIFNGANTPAIIINQTKVSENEILAILNSKLITYYLNQICPKKLGGYFRYNSTNISNIPFIHFTEHQLSDVNVLVEKIKLKSLNYRQIMTKFINYLQSQFSIEKLPRKLQNWQELSFSEFITELNKSIKTIKGIPLTKKDEFEWIDLFEENKQKALSLKAEIDKTDKEIDQMVYALYELTEEEIRIVEGL